MPVTAGNATDHATVPDHASCPAQASEAATVEHQPANATAATCPRTPGISRRTPRYTVPPTTGASTAMLNTLAPSAVTPPSAKRKHCAMSTVAITTTAAGTPSSAAMSAPPIKWPDVPPTTGKFTICAANTNAAPSPSSGTFRGGSSRRT